MDKEYDYTSIKKRRVYYKGIFRRFKIISNVELTKEELSNIVFTINEEKRVCDANVIAKDIKVKTCSLSSNNGKRWVIKINC